MNSKNITMNLDNFKKDLSAKKKQRKTTMENVRKLEDVIHEIKINHLVNTFARKISMNNVEREPVDFTPFDEKVDRSEEMNGMEIPNILLNGFYVISILNTVVMWIIASMSVIFTEATSSQQITSIQTWATVWMVIEIVVNFLRVTYGKNYNKLEKIRDIASGYFKSRFGIDLLCLAGLIIDLVIESEATIAARIAFFLKVVDLMDKIEALETKLLNTSYKEHCWGLIKIFLTNFMLAHFLAVLLIMVTWLNEKENWLSKVNAMRAPWYEQYSWAYYWGTTIMFTVGFGDISAVNYQEAWLVVLIQTFSCITLAYNLNCVGTLINNLRTEEIEKVKKQKILKHLSEKNNISPDLTARINNYIEECSNIKKNFNLEEDSAFISSLPSSIKASFLRESNSKIFKHLPFFSNLTNSSILELAEKIEMSIAHP